MLQIVPTLSLINIRKEFRDAINNISLRGYFNKTPITVPADFITVLKDGTLKPLSVDSITNIFCPTKRDLYMSRVLNKGGKINWGRRTGQVVDDFIKGFTEKFKNDSTIARIKRYQCFLQKSSKYISAFSRKKVWVDLSKFKSTPVNPDEDQNWLLRTLDYALRRELMILRVSKILSRSDSKKIDIQKMSLNPNSKILGISSPSTPDFVIPKISVIGDIKTGIEFKHHFRLAVAGYALAYENQFKRDMNLGIVYFFPTRQKDISFAHLHIFVIDDVLRNNFLQMRNEALATIMDSKKRQPAFASRDECRNLSCKFIDECEKLRKK